MNSIDLLKQLQHNNQKPNKSLGQNFLTDDNILRKTVAAAGVDNNTGVLEIGAGAGALTHILSQFAKEVIAIELDKNLVVHLEGVFNGYDNVKIIQSDALKCDLNEVIAQNISSERVIIVANMPY